MGRKIKFKDSVHIRRRQAVRRHRRHKQIYQFGKYHGIEEMSSRDIDQLDREKADIKKLEKLKRVLREKYLTPVQVSRRLKIPVQKVYKLLKSKKIKAERTFIRAYSHYIAERWKIPEEAVEEFKTRGRRWRQ